MARKGACQHCNRNLQRCKKCGNVGCDKVGCKGGAFMSNKCLKCGALGASNRERVM